MLIRDNLQKRDEAFGHFERIYRQEELEGNMLTRRTFLGSTTATLALAAMSGSGAAFEIERSTAEWRQRLTPAQFAVLREEATERPYTNHLNGERSPLLNEHRAGAYNCAGCALPVYRSETKFDSNTGWPSFFRAVSGNPLSALWRAFGPSVQRRPRTDRQAPLPERACLELYPRCHRSNRRLANPDISYPPRGD
jgi:hypothetical protein